MGVCQIGLYVHRAVACLQHMKVYGCLPDRFVCPPDGGVPTRSRSNWIKMVRNAREGSQTFLNPNRLQLHVQYSTSNTGRIHTRCMSAYDRCPKIRETFQVRVQFSPFELNNTRAVPERFLGLAHMLTSYASNSTR